MIRLLYQTLLTFTRQKHLIITFYSLPKSLSSSEGESHSGVGSPAYQSPAGLWEESGAFSLCFCRIRSCTTTLVCLQCSPSVVCSCLVIIALPLSWGTTTSLLAGPLLFQLLRRFSSLFSRLGPSPAPHSLSSSTAARLV